MALESPFESQARLKAQERFEELFTDREKPMASFNTARGSIPKDDQKILVFHGVGGQGKSWLCQKMQRALIQENQSHPEKTTQWGVLDFELGNLRDSANGLLELRRSLSRSGPMTFFAFDIAISRYWELAFPEVSFQGANRDLFDSGEGIFSEVVDTAVAHGEDLPAGAGLAIKALNYLRKKIRDEVTERSAWAKPSIEALEQFELLNDANPQKAANNIKERLGYYLAKDLQSHRLRHPEQDIIVFLDTFEALRAEVETNIDTGSLQADDWVRSFIEGSPGVLLVILGRDKLFWHKNDSKWTDYLKDQHHLTELSRQDTDKYLLKIPINEENIREKMLDASQGHPFYLQLDAELYLEISEKTDDVSPDDFGQNKQDIYQKFMEYRPLQERETIKLLSVAQSFDRALFTELIRHFQTGYPITGFDTFLRYSFVLNSDDSEASLHQLMREHVINDLSDELRTEVNQYLFQYYEVKININSPREITQEHVQALTECVYHYPEINSETTLVQWLNSKWSVFYEATQWKILQTLWEKALSLTNRSESTSLDRAICLAAIGRLNYAEGRYGEAEPLYLESLEIRKKQLGDEHPSVATSLNNLAGLYRAQGRYSEAEPLYLESLEIRKKQLGDEHPSVANSLNNLALLYRAQGRYSEAEPLYLEGLDISKEQLGDEHPDVATSLSNLAGLYRAQGRYSEAEPLFLEDLRISKKQLGDEHPDVATSLNNLALLYRAQGRYSEAEPLFLESLEIWKKQLGDEHPDVATSLNNLALLYESQGRYSEAEPLFLEDLRISKKQLGDEHPDVATSLNNLASLYDSQGRYNEAEPLYLDAIAILENKLGDEHPNTKTGKANYQGLLEKMNNQGNE